MLIQAIKTAINENKIKTVGATITALAAIFGFLWSFDAHYAKAADLEQIESKVTRGQQQMQLDLLIQLNKQSLLSLDEKLADIEDKEAARKADPTDRAKKARLMRKQQELQREIEIASRQKFQLGLKDSQAK